jgi:hypothetical protein
VLDCSEQVTRQSAFVNSVCCCSQRLCILAKYYVGGRVAVRKSITSPEQFRTVCLQNLSSCWAEFTFGSGPIVVGNVTPVCRICLVPKASCHIMGKFPRQQFRACGCATTPPVLVKRAFVWSGFSCSCLKRDTVWSETATS